MKAREVLHTVLKVTHITEEVFAQFWRRLDGLSCGERRPRKEI
jgi:hypothetical protein